MATKKVTKKTTKKTGRRQEPGLNQKVPQKKKTVTSKKTEKTVVKRVTNAIANSSKTAYEFIKSIGQQSKAIALGFIKGIKNLTNKAKLSAIFHTISQYAMDIFLIVGGMFTGLLAFSLFGPLTTILSILAVSIAAKGLSYVLMTKRQKNAVKRDIKKMFNLNTGKAAA